jgi:tetratricopeptide (TPR) repeat protein
MSSALAINHNLAPAYNYRGKIYIYTDNITGAVQEFTSALALDPDLAEAYKLRGFLEIELKHSAEALADLNKAIELDATDAMAYFYRGHLHNANEDFDKALDDLDRALALNPPAGSATATFDPFSFDAGGIHLERAVALRGQQQLSLAVEAGRKSVELDPNYARAYVTLGEMLIVNGDLEEALIILSKAILLDPNLAEAYFNRAVAYEVTAITTKNFSYYDVSAADLRMAIKVTSDPNIIEAANAGLRAMQSHGYIP